MKENHNKELINDAELYNFATNNDVKRVFSLHIKDYSKFGFYYDFKNNKTRCFKCGFSYQYLLKPQEFQKMLFIHLFQNGFECELKEGHNRYLKFANENECLDIGITLVPVVEQFLKYKTLQYEEKNAEFYADQLAPSQPIESNEKAKKRKLFTGKDVPCYSNQIINNKMSVISFKILHKEESKNGIYKIFKNYFNIYISKVPKQISNVYIYNFFGENYGIILENIVRLDFSNSNAFFLKFKNIQKCDIIISDLDKKFFPDFPQENSRIRVLKAEYMSYEDELNEDDQYY